MKYYLVITPKPLIDALLSESQRLMKEVYDKDIDLIYYRVQTKQELDNPRKLFFKGDGRVLETQVKPHISLVHNIELEDTEEFVKEADKICKQYSPFQLSFSGVGNYDMDFTFFVRFNDVPKLNKLRDELLKISKDHMSKEEYEQHYDENFVPHATVLYDDIDPEKVLKAFEMLDKDKFKEDIPVNEIVLWGVSPTEQKPVHTFKFG